MALYSVLSDRLFCGQPGDNLLWPWFLDRELAEGSFNHGALAKNHQRLGLWERGFGFCPELTVKPLLAAA